MNKWQISFLVFGLLATIVLVLFPPQFLTDRTVRFLFIGSGHPVDWLRFFFWFLAIFFVTGLGIAINKEEHR